MKGLYEYTKTASKYGNIKTKYKGIKFDSKKEAEYAMLLDSMKKAKDPSDRVVKIEYQPVFPIEVNCEKICKYYADFRVEYADGRIEVIDVKGVRTGVYKIKKKLVEALYDIEIIEV